MRLAKGRSIWLSSRENDLLDQAQNILSSHDTLSYMVKGVDLTNMQRTAVIYQLDFSKAEVEEQLYSSLVLDGSCSFCRGRIQSGHCQRISWRRRQTGLTAGLH